MFVLVVAGIVGFILVVAIVATVAKFYVKVEPGTALVRRGQGGGQVSFNGKLVIPIAHRADIMDISVRRIEIYRHGSEGLICKDNVRADIKVAFFVRVNNVDKDVLQVADSIGVKRASQLDALVELFDAKFSEALKTVGKKFDFTELYTERERFKDAILEHLGTDLNGYVLDDAAIDYLEQTELGKLDPKNILDAEGIKKITDLTAREAILANDISREKEKTITKQDVEAREAILELERQQAEAEAKQAREIATVQAREQAESQKVEEEERYKSEKARIATEEELGIAEENKLRQILVAQRAKERTDAVETERVQREQGLEMTERERVVELARIEKETALEVERKKIQDVIRERVVVERAVVEEEQKIKDTEEIMTAERAKSVQVTTATAQAEEEKIKEVKKAEAAKLASQFEADEILIEAEAKRAAAEKEALAKMKLAEARQAEAAADGLAEAEVMDAKAGAVEKYGTAEAEVVQRKLEAEAKGDFAKAEAIKAKGSAEADVMQAKYAAEADGVAGKAEAMKKLDGVGKEHEEFKLNLDKQLQVELKQIDIHKDIAAEQAKVLGEALKSANIDIVGGESEFFDTIIHAITKGKQVDRLVDNSDHLARLSDSLLSSNGDGTTLADRIGDFVSRSGIDSDDVKNLSIAALIGKMIADSSDQGVVNELKNLLSLSKAAGYADQKLASLGVKARA
ncbi:MAG: flotillin family protein [Planctomycetota bacterium]